MAEETVGWPTQLETATAAARVLARAWANVAAGNLDPSPEDAEEARRVFGHRPVEISEEIPPVGGPTWPPRSTPRPSWFGGTLLPVLHVVEDVERVEGPDAEGPGAVVTYPAVANGPRSDERPHLGVLGPPFAPSPAGTHGAALSVLTARELASRIRDYAVPLLAREARPWNAESLALNAWADSIEPFVDSTSREWLKLARRCLPETPSAGVRPAPDRVAASMRRA